MSTPSILLEEESELLKNIYVQNDKNRLRQLDIPQENDMKRWPYELIQNAKDSISSFPDKKAVSILIEATDEYVKFQHDGAPFTSKALLGLLYQYSSEKRDSESVGRFGTGFMTTHCLSKEVSISSNMFTNKERTSIQGFSVTIYRDGENEDDLLNGINQMKKVNNFQMN
jgi:hypothetical protein